MSDTDRAWQINNDGRASSAMCECGHPRATHGSNGYICCCCKCKEFALAVHASGWPVGHMGQLQ